MSVIEILRREGEPEKFESGEKIFAKGDPGDFMYFVVEGAVDIMVDGNLIYTIYEGQTVGEMAIIDPAPRSADVVAQVDTQLIKIDRDRFHQLVAQMPYFAVQVMGLLVSRIRKMTELGHDPV